MKSVLFDLRGRALQVLVVEGEAVSYVQSFEKFDLDDAGNCDRVLAEISNKAGVNLDKVHCIMPSEDVSVSTMTIPAMSLADAEKVIRRRLIKDTGTQAPIFHIVPMGTGGDKQSCIVETIKRESLERYVAFFQIRKIAVQTISTALPSNLRALKKLDRDLSEIIALLDIGNDIIEMTILSDHVISYGKSAILHLDVEKELQSGRTPERIQKMHVYRIVEAVYNAQSDYKKEYPHDPIAKIWVCGTAGSLDGVLEALTESMNVDSKSVVLSPEMGHDGSRYMALYGLALGLLEGTVVNYLPREMTRRRHLFAPSRSTVIAAAGVFAMLAAVTAGILEVRHQRVTALLADRIRNTELANLDPGATRLYAKNSAHLKSLIAKQVAWRPLLGYLADNTPDGMYVEGLSLKSPAGVPALEILFITPAYSEIGVKKYLTTVITMIDKCGLLRRTGEPTITITRQEKNKLLHFKVTCEVLSGEN